MYSIIIERSQDAMQVVWIFTKETFKNTKDLSWTTRWYANQLAHNKKIDDYDVYEFDTLDELNEFLLSNLTI